MPGDEPSSHGPADGDPAGSPASPSPRPAAQPATSQPGTPPAGRRLGIWPPAAPAIRWLSIFGVSLGLLLVRFLVPTPVGQADNRDGPRLMCGIGLQPVTGHHPRFFRFAYFEYVLQPSCAGHHPYPSAELVPLELSRLLTPVFGLPGTLNLIALGVLWCVLASAGIASLATGLRIRLWAQLLVAAAVWLIIADAAFFDVFASPFSEPAALVGLLLVAAGVLYLGQGWRVTVWGLVLAGGGGFLAILSKEQYLVLAAPVCLTLVLAASRGPWRGLRRFRNRETAAAGAVAGVLVLFAAAYWIWDYTSSYGRRLHHIQAVDMIFTDIVTNWAKAPGQLRALGLPVAWARYAGHYYWDETSIRQSPLYGRYVDKLTDGNIVHYLFTHPASILTVGQSAAVYAQQFRVTTLGDYQVPAGHRKGTYESRVIVLTTLMHHFPAHLGLWLYVPLWLAMAALGIIALALGHGRAWHRSGAAAVLCLTGCAAVAFVPPAYFAGISTTRHMVGSNLATALACTISVVLAVSLAQHALSGRRRRPAAAAPPAAVPAGTPVSPGPRR